MKSQKGSLSDILRGKGREFIPNIAFIMMAFFMKVVDVLFGYSNRNFKTLELKPGQTVIDYGCGPARYVKNASETVGDNGKVYAVDIHHMAVKEVENKIRKFNLKNVEAVLAAGYSSSISDNTADVIYALDMFHMIENAKNLLFEFSRMLKPDGHIIIEDGHQPRAETIRKIEDTGIFKVFEENKKHVRCRHF